MPETLGAPPPFGEPTPAMASCASHAGAPATGTCPRCGRFTCPDCGGTGTCHGCLRLQLSALPSSDGRALWTRRLLRAAVPIEAVGIIVAAWWLSSDDPSPFHGPLERTYTLISVGLFLATVIVFLRWLHLIVRQTRVLGIDIQASPGWAVGWWFVPFANLVKPYRIMANLLRGLGGEPLVAGSHVGAWWGCWVVMNLSSNAQSRLMLTDPESGYGLALAVSVMTIISALLCRRIVGLVEDEVRQARERLG